MSVLTHIHRDPSAFSLSSSAYKSLVDFYLFAEMERDTPYGDKTTQILQVASDSTIQATIRAKSSGIVAGVEEVKYFFETLEIKSEWNFADGDEIQKGDILVQLEGSAQVILKAERAALNFLARLSGVASLTQKYVKAVQGKVLIATTRKTLWGLLDKKAVYLGGGGTHRLNLSDAVLIKENHISLLKDKNILELKKLFQSVSVSDFGRFCEIEVETLEQAQDAVKVLSSLLNIPGIIMFDNFSPKDIQNCLPSLKKENLNILYEASGGICLGNIHSYIDIGVDILSIGALTHSAPAFDYSLIVL